MDRTLVVYNMIMILLSINLLKVHGSMERLKNLTSQQSKSSRGHGAYRVLDGKEKLDDPCLLHGLCVTKLACKCDDLCHVFDDCCYDTITRPPSNSSSIWSLKKQFSCFGEKRYETGRHCWIISKCPTVWKSKDVKLKCESPDPSHLDEAIPIYANGFHFRNRFCVACNNAMRDGEPWSMRVNAETCDLFQIYKYGDIDLALKDVLQTFRMDELGCEFFFEPPEKHPCRQCYPGIVDNCNKSTVETTDYYIGCLYYTNIIYLFGNFYKNFMCALCLGSDMIKTLNTVYTGGVEDFCPDVKNFAFDGSINENGPHYNSSLLWSITLRQPKTFWKPLADSVESGYCNEESCKCPERLIPDDGECVSPFIHFNNVIMLEKMVRCNVQSDISTDISANISTMSKDAMAKDQTSTMGLYLRNESFRIFQWNVKKIGANEAIQQTTSLYIVRVLYTIVGETNGNVKWPWEDICEYEASSDKLISNLWIYVATTTFYFIQIHRF